MLKFLTRFQNERITGWRSKYFRKSFILILLIAFIPGLLTGIGIQWFGVGEVEEELMELHERQIAQRIKNVDDQFEYLETSLAHWAFDPKFGYSLNKLDFVREFQKTREITNSLLVLQGSHPLIDQVELFVISEEPVLFTPNYRKITEMAQSDFYQSLLEKGQNMGWERVAYASAETDFVKSDSIMLTHSIPGGNREPFGTINVTLDSAKVAQLLKTLTPYNEGATFLLNEEGQMLLAADTTDDHSFTSFLKAQVLHEEEESGSFSAEYADEMYSVSFGKIRRIGTDWIYVSATPMSSITSPIVFISNLIVNISIIGLLMALCMSWLASASIYSPVGKLMKVFAGEKMADGFGKNSDEFEMMRESWTNLSNKSELLQRRLTEQVPAIKQSFLLQLIKGYLYHYSEEDLRSRMESYGWQVSDKTFIILDVQLTGLNDLETCWNKDESLVTFTAVNIIEEVAGIYFHQYTILNYHDLSVGMFIVLSEESENEVILKRFADELTATINEIIHLKVTVTISNPAKHVKRVPYLVEEVSKGKRYRNFENQNQYINLSQVTGEQQQYKVFYPFEIEKEIIQATRRGEVKEAELLTGRFLDELVMNGMTEINIQTGIIQLFSSIQKEILHSGIHPDEIFHGKNMYEELAQFREPQRMAEWLLEEVIRPYVETLESRLNFELKQLVEHVISHIHEHYMEDISLESCADEIGINPYTLSRAFKKIAGINFIDYLTRLRIEEAKELLLNTDMMISDISEKVGYRHSYFNRIFKKHVGIPPSQYRKMKSRTMTIAVVQNNDVTL
ncbi:Cache domain-containing protein [Evansella caseinilytica]|uniref:Cache domain-containing protein n=1 Tax=Evansella caseinilytica TaxID=1503961 RepID=A0A1H3GM34_9BACI|nr:helix-turn-helix domain-containing protein [Evansella caseinilytica]SDY03369.1 Cache domain-containing protein [Evansella caseinilytica]